MSDNKTARPNSQIGIDLGTWLGFALAVMFFVGGGLVSFLAIEPLNSDRDDVAQAHDVLMGLDGILSIVKDAETSQRGFIITYQEIYLVRYSDALASIDEEVLRVGKLVKENPDQYGRMAILKFHIAARVQTLDAVIELRRSDDLTAVAELVGENDGKEDMDAIRAQIALMLDTAKTLRQQRIAEMDSSYATAVLSVAITALVGVLLSAIIAIMLSRASAGRREQEWLKTGQVGLSAAMMGDQRLDQLGSSILSFLSEYTGGNAGAFYALTDGVYHRTAMIGVPEQNSVPVTFTPGVGLLGQAVSAAKPIDLHDLADSQLTIGAALGQWRPRHLLISPARSERTVDAVIELGFLSPLLEPTRDFLELVSESISVAVKTANYRDNLGNLLAESQRQSEEMQSQAEELRVNNEELEEQSRALSESHARLEQQQVELEQTNLQLKGQADTLERQKDELSRTSREVEFKAREIEQASRYKSDFLANMSHELRTPLNSSLILAKLLGDNPDGNLTEEQVKFADTIQASGNDLLALINDILDLSKIEAGQMEIRAEGLSLVRLMKDMQRTFDPVAAQKGVLFRVKVAKDLPETIETDRQRLEQVLRNLLSNAFKFTETGSVELALSSNADGRVVMAVTDTGIGISNDHQATIFEAFRQADGTINRKYGGTGLGLSISRELTRLLGGGIALKSTPGTGSTFALTLPLSYDPESVTTGLIVPLLTSVPEGDTLAIVETEPRVARDEALKKPLPLGQVQDDRDRLDPNRRIILIVEDDLAFAGILYDVAHGQDFLCLVATSAEEALEMVQQYTPSAVVLDIGLPDHSGLSVLDRLKRDNRTRHIPVHVVSGSDYQHTALSLGAIGYMLKPVKRDELVDAFKSLESRLSQGMHRVLIVEDDEVLRDSISRLLKSNDTEIIAVGTTAECLERLKTQTFDCMVLDLTLPDGTGYSLLETLSQENAYAFPPVIVYTGHDISYDDEQKLRRYSSSIIIKGAKSPERLLDEVTLFLHQVVSEMSPEQQTLLKKAKNRDAVLEGRRILIVEDDVRNVYAVTNIFESLGAIISIARNGREALDMLETTNGNKGSDNAVDLVLMDVMMPEMDGLTATREIRKRRDWVKLPIIMLTAKAMKDDQERCIDAGANDYMSKPLDVDKLISLVRVWMPR